jgi:hypothetical protein
MPKQKPSNEPKATNPEAKPPKRKENPLKHFAEEVEEHLIEGGEMATSTTSAETNVVLSVLGAIEGPQVPKEQPEKQENARKRNKPRPKAR